MRIGLIGLGRIGAFHAETLSGLPAVTSLVVADAVPAVTERIAGKFGAERAASPGAVLTSGINGVVIAAATDAHPQLILAAVEAGLPVFCEKPVAKGAAEAEEVLRHCAGAGVQIGYNRRFDPGFVAARAAIAAGELGRLHTVRSTTMDPAPPPAAYLAGSGGIFHDCSVHDFDIIRFVTGREVVEVYATGSTAGDEIFAQLGDASTTAATLTLDDGTIAVVSNTRYNGRGYDVRLEAHGSADSIAVGWEERLPMRSVEPGVAFPGGTPHGFFMDRFAEAYRRELSAFTEVVAGTRTSPCTVADAVAAGWIAEACTVSLRDHRPVRVDEVRSAA
ncbi:Gfo/Idh/MocA family protein [Actinoplanes friuliensis]|uniref:Oxidoreductase domain-containing protein n=1 Tax=Actinoplanes friuliensis DSM 7358 TaxID=1246995 RepID=U5VPS7_9ACTN|nr:Gfo/Idh/MocA family oxidoreductase [Actinoplanes friuliensis]AGZ38963.1 oxidoreductase domain-containing protein [Actinoplanes friuliensis DSM 7358]